ncbi:MAG: hypothetical protein LBV34_28425, partial [Nocardiopsaceae bacterium]|nr:hypothetical protein [Nocardiopsaceae bacterium]
NADGFGVGWYADGDPTPARYRRSGPIWADDCLPDLARVTTTRAMLCAVRSASVGTGTEASAAAPYADGSWLFSLNGALVGWSAAAGGPTTPPSPETAAAVLRLAGRLTAAELLALQARSDTALLWALVLSRLRAGQTAASALAGTVSEVWAAGATGRFNMLLTDGHVIAATAAGDSLCCRQRADGVVVASEPSDDHEDWQKVPDSSVVEATMAGVAVRAIEPPETPRRFAPATTGQSNGRRDS